MVSSNSPFKYIISNTNRSTRLPSQDVGNHNLCIHCVFGDWIARSSCIAMSRFGPCTRVGEIRSTQGKWHIIYTSNSTTQFQVLALDQSRAVIHYIFSTCHHLSFISSSCIVTSSPSSILIIFSTLHSLLLRWMIQRCFSLLYTTLPNHQSEQQRAVRSQSGYAMTAVVACSYRTCGTARRCFSVTHTRNRVRVTLGR
jgi:hypothetical protein